MAPINVEKFEKSRGAPASGLFQKTRMCKFKRLNLCTRGESCTYAHSQSELMPLPNLYKTKMCFEMSKNKHCQNPSCPYAHSKTELRTIAYKNAEMEEKRNGQISQDFSLGGNFSRQKPAYWYPPSPSNAISNSPWTRESNAPAPHFGLEHMQPSMMGLDNAPFDESPCSNSPMSMPRSPMSMPKDAFMLPPKEDLPPRFSNASTKMDWTLDSTIYDSNSPEEFTGSDYSSEREEMMGETPAMPEMTWTVKNTFLELTLPPNTDQSSAPGRMSRCSSSPVFI